jgi:hypothetical protein
MKSFATFALPMLRLSIALGVVPRMARTFAVEMKSNSQSHRNTSIRTLQTALSVERLCYQLADWIRVSNLAHGDEGAHAIDRDWPLIFNAVAALNVLLFPFLK